MSTSTSAKSCWACSGVILDGALASAWDGPAGSVQPDGAGEGAGEEVGDAAGTVGGAVGELDSWAGATADKARQSGMAKSSPRRGKTTFLILHNHPVPLPILLCGNLPDSPTRCLNGSICATHFKAIIRKRSCASDSGKTAPGTPEKSPCPSPISPATCRPLRWPPCLNPHTRLTNWPFTTAR